MKLLKFDDLKRARTPDLERLARALGLRLPNSDLKEREYRHKLISSIMRKEKELSRMPRKNRPFGA